MLMAWWWWIVAVTTLTIASATFFEILQRDGTP
jgi:hypothetical protein